MLKQMNLVEELRMNGYSLLPGLTHFISSLSPLENAEAWNALSDDGVSRLLTKHFHAKARRWLLNDTGCIEGKRQPPVCFATKTDKCHLSIQEGVEELISSPKLPSAISRYFGSAYSFMRVCKEYLSEILPQPSLPTTLVFRAFLYKHSDPLAELRPKNARPTSMRPHVDPSVVTLIMAASDGLLKLESNRKTETAVHPAGNPFSLLIPGIAAPHDLKTNPTRHWVESSVQCRISITIFMIPDLGVEGRRKANSLRHQWRLAQSK